MSESFLSSDEYDEKAHPLQRSPVRRALDLLRDGVTRYPHAVELHVGVGYAQLAREEYAWARPSSAPRSTPSTRTPSPASATCW